MRQGNARAGPVAVSVKVLDSVEAQETRKLRLSLLGDQNIGDTEGTGATKDNENEENQGSEARKLVEELKNLIGLDTVKSGFEGLEKYVKYSKLTGVDIQQDRFHAVFQGNPGTGKSTFYPVSFGGFSMSSCMDAHQERRLSPDFTPGICTHSESCRRTSSLRLQAASSRPRGLPKS